MPSFLKAQAITKAFGSLIANDRVDLSVETGEIHGIIGENGAGKSTLMKMLYGMYRPDSGRLLVQDQEVSFRSPAEALKLGIGMVHQHFMLVNEMSVLENMILGDEPTHSGWIDEDSALQSLASLSTEIESKLEPHRLVGDLTVGQQQSLEILKLLFRKSECLIFDEPTGVLTPQEIDKFLNVLRRLQKNGKTILLITHKLNEILAVCDRVTILRAGRSVGVVDAKTTTASELARLMVGREVRAMQGRLARKEYSRAKPMLEVKDLSAGRLKDIHFQISPGEILGVAGIEGNGQKDLAEVLWGLLPVKSGRLCFEGEELPIDSVTKRKHLGFSYIPEDRHREGLVLDQNLLENFYLGNEGAYSNPFFFPTEAIRADLNRAIETFEIKSRSPRAAVRTLSGGNQQKIILARELKSNPKLLISAQPTRGVDIGAIERIHHELIKRRDEGLAILLISSELDELLSLSDRMIVLREFALSATFDRLDGDWTELRYKIGEAMICHS